MTEWTFSFLPGKFTELVKGYRNTEAQNVSKTSGRVKPSAPEINTHAPLTHINIRRNLAYP